MPTLGPEPFAGGQDRRQVALGGGLRVSVSDDACLDQPRGRVVSRTNGNVCSPTAVIAQHKRNIRRPAAVCQSWRPVMSALAPGPGLQQLRPPVGMVAQRPA